jgi:hypothetical protein
MRSSSLRHGPRPHGLVIRLNGPLQPCIPACLKMLVMPARRLLTGLFDGCKNLRARAGLGGSLEVATPFGDFRFF